MSENWEVHWEDYYEILQIHPSAEPEIIKAAYGKLAQKYHPDVSKDPTAEERTKKINLAHEVLSNPEKRKQYDAEWFRKSGVTGKSSSPKPKPVVDPQYIQFADTKPGETQTASFIIRNAGGPFNKIKVWVDNPNSWARVASYSSLTESDELPLQVKVEAEGADWNKTYSEVIRVKLDEEETHIKVELRTKPEPVKAKVNVGAKPSTGYAYGSPPSPPVTSTKGALGWGKWKWIFGFLLLGLIVGITSPLWSSDNQPSTISPASSSFSISTPNPAQTALEVREQQIGKNLEKYCQESMPTPPRNSLSYNNDYAFTYQYDYVFIEEHVWARVGRFWMYGPGRILYSTNNGDSWEVQWGRERTSLNSMLFLNEYEGIVGIDRDTLIKTSDGGKTWNKFFTLHNMPEIGLWWIDSYEVKDKQNITVRSFESLFVTKDGGETWEKLVYYTLYYGATPTITGVLRTRDGGETWEKINIRYQ